MQIINPLSTIFQGLYLQDKLKEELFEIDRTNTKAEGGLKNIGKNVRYNNFLDFK